jgi:hypothetical protein
MRKSKKGTLLSAFFAFTFSVLKSRGERIRTSDLSVPNRALYQAEPRPEVVQESFLSQNEFES